MRKLLKVILVLIVADLLICSIYYKIVTEDFPVTNNINVDAIVVFEGGYNWKNHKLMRETKLRLDHVVALFKQQKINTIICVGAAKKNKNDITGMVMKQYLLQKGIDKEFIFYDSLSYDTKTNWQEAVKIIKAKKIQSIVIVSSALHLFRIASLVQLPEVYYSAYPIRFNSVKKYLSILESIHYEWMAWLGWFLPDRVSTALIKWKRQAI